MKSEIAIEVGQKWQNHDSGYVVEVEKVGRGKVTVKRVGAGLRGQVIRTQIDRKRFGLTTKKGLSLVPAESSPEPEVAATPPVNGSVSEPGVPPNGQYATE
jgi:hypothetical protein